MYGLIGKMTAQPGKGRDLAELMLRVTKNMPGNISYDIAVDKSNPDIVWITEVWDDAEAHQKSLMLPEIQAAITEARPMIAGLERVAETEPVS